MPSESRGPGPTMADLMTPGFSTDRPDEWPSRKKLATPKPPEKGLNMATEAEAVPDMTPEMAEIIDKLNEAMEGATQRGSSPVFSLAGPETLTIKKRDGDFAKKPHIGGEEFHPVGVYMGKRNRLIYRFRPAAAADYGEMEMPEQQAFKSLMQFKAYVTQIVGVDLEREKREAAEKASLDAERAKLADRAEVYSDLGFGSW